MLVRSLKQGNDIPSKSNRTTFLRLQDSCISLDLFWSICEEKHTLAARRGLPLEAKYAAPRADVLLLAIVCPRKYKVVHATCGRTGTGTKTVCYVQADAQGTGKRSIPHHGRTYERQDRDCKPQADEQKHRAENEIVPHATSGRTRGGTTKNSLHPVTTFV